MNDTKFYCDVSALTSQERGRYQEFAKLLMPMVKAIDELDNGYAVQFPMSPVNFTMMAEFVTYESRCCPFLSFALKTISGEETASLDITGPEDAKPFIQAELGLA